jgi:hypothetical protein
MMVVLVLHAAHAQAQAWRFLEKLSGPGNFYGYEVEFKLLCRYEPKAGERPLVLLPVSLPCIFKHTTDDKSSGSTTFATVKDPKTNEATEIEIDLKKRVWAIAVATSYLSGTTNTLPYDRPVDRIVRLASLEESFDFRLIDRVDAGVAVGQNWFFPPDTRFFRWSIEPRLTWKLFDVTRDHNAENVYWGTLSLRAGVLIFSDPFNAADFGAVGPYVSHGQYVASVRLIVDFDRNPFKPGK